MKGTSKVIMGATLVMVVSLAIVLGIVLVLLAELYCSLLLRRRKLKHPASSTSTNAIVTAPTASVASANTNSSQPPPLLRDPTSSSPLSSFYAQGVLHAPRSFLFPSLSLKDNKTANAKDHKHHVLEIQSQEHNTSPHHIGLISTSSPVNSFAASPKELEVPVQCIDKACSKDEHLVYISNPIYDNDGVSSQGCTPFETPDTSPSRLETGGSSSSGEEEIVQSSDKCPELVTVTPPLTPMKKLPAEACSVSLRDARSLGTSVSDSNSQNCVFSSSSGSPCTSPSW